MWRCVCCIKPIGDSTCITCPGSRHLICWSWYIGKYGPSEFDCIANCPVQGCSSSWPANSIDAIRMEILIVDDLWAHFPFRGSKVIPDSYASAMGMGFGCVNCNECLEDCNSLLTVVSCKHTFCMNCVIKQIIMMKIESNDTQSKCPAVGCWESFKGPFHPVVVSRYHFEEKVCPSKAGLFIQTPTEYLDPFHRRELKQMSLEPKNLNQMPVPEKAVQRNPVFSDVPVSQCIPADDLNGEISMTFEENSINFHTPAFCSTPIRPPTSSANIRKGQDSSGNSIPIISPPAATSGMVMATVGRNTSDISVVAAASGQVAVKKRRKRNGRKRLTVRKYCWKRTGKSSTQVLPAVSKQRLNEEEGLVADIPTTHVGKSIPEA